MSQFGNASVFLFTWQLLTSAAVHKWGSEIQEGIFDMLLLLTDLVVARLQHDPVPVGLLEALNLVSVEYKTWLKGPEPNYVPCSKQNLIKYIFD